MNLCGQRIIYFKTFADNISQLYRNETHSQLEYLLNGVSEEEEEEKDEEEEDDDDDEEKEAIQDNYR
jgi:hypothetical protein